MTVRLLPDRSIWGMEGDISAGRCATVLDSMLSNRLRVNVSKFSSLEAVLHTNVNVISPGHPIFYERQEASEIQILRAM